MRLVLIAVALGIAAIVGWRYFGANDPAGSGAALAEVRVPDLDAAARVGQKAFNENCAACHGVNAAGRDGLSPPLVHKIYEPSHHGDQAFHAAAKRGVRAHHWTFGNMPPVEGIADDEIDSIVTYVRTLQRANGIR